MTPWTAACQTSLSLTISQSCPSSCPAHQWCHPTISSSVTSSAFNLSQHQGVFQWVSCSHQVNIDASASVLSMSIQDWFPLRLTSLTSLLSKGLSIVFSSTEVQKWEEIGIWTKVIIVERKRRWIGKSFHKGYNDYAIDWLWRPREGNKWEITRVEALWQGEW